VTGEPPTLGGVVPGDSTTEGPEQQPATVLVVDDTMLPRVTLARGVEHEGHRVVQADNGRTALDVLRAQPVDMVLLDLVMPDVDGFDVLAAMRSDPALREIPVLVVSATEATEDVARAIGMGAIDCLPKPFEPALLRVRLRTALEQTRLRRLEQDYLRQELALRQQERLAMLGRLSAGLGHELNNPAAAALSTSRQLRRALERTEALLPRITRDAHGAALVEAVTAALERDDGAEHGHGVRPAYDRADGIEEVLTRHGVPDPWSVSDELATAGLDGDALDRVLGTGADVSVALDWLRVRAQVRVSLDHISGSVERMAGLTSALRRYSYLDRAPQQDVDVREGLDDTLTILAHKIPDAVRVVREYADDVPSIHAYGGQLNQVWTNLVDNAVDAVGGAGTITVRARPEDGGVLVEVVDDGVGVPADLIGDVFDPFVTTKPPGKGTGLGLNIAHHIVTEVHGGRLTAESEPGHTAFSVWLPATPPRPDAGEEQ
jgi:signal transduction histidine kinase